MNYEVVERDFISGTLDLIDQYHNLIVGSVPEREQYEVTLLVSSLLGLVVLPFEHKKRVRSS